METEPYSRAVRVDGEVVVLHCWACGTAHCVNLEVRAPEQLPHMLCSNDRCKMSMFLVNELETALDQRTKTDLSTWLPVYSRFWK